MKNNQLLSKKTHDTMRKLQLVFAALSGALGILTATLDLGQFGVVTAAIISAFSYFFGQLTEDDSARYFTGKEIVEKEEEVHG